MCYKILFMLTLCLLSFELFSRGCSSSWPNTGPEPNKWLIFAFRSPSVVLRGLWLVKFAGRVGNLEFSGEFATGKPFIGKGKPNNKDYISWSLWEKCLFSFAVVSTVMINSLWVKNCRISSSNDCYELKIWLLHFLDKLSNTEAIQVWKDLYNIVKYLVVARSCCVSSRVPACADLLILLNLGTA